jgi:hypothetical protein
MSKIIMALGLFIVAGTVYAACSTHTYISGGRIITCTTCCMTPNNCTTTCF